MSRLAAPLAVALGLALVPSACDASPHQGPDRTSTAAATITGSWEPSPDAPFPGSLRGRVSLPASDETVVTITLRNARFTAVPEACEPSTVVRRKSRIVDGNARLLCTLLDAEAAHRIDFAAVAAGAEGEEMGGTIHNEADGAEVDLPALVIDEAPASLSPRLRLLSSPDFLNADVGDLRRGPGFWNPRRSTNSINGDYRRTLDAVLDDWQSTDPDGVLVAGDLVEGHWGTDAARTGNFGPVRTLPEQLDALHRAAGTYYPQYLERFAQHDLTLFPAAGDHEYGDNPWPASKRARIPAFRDEFADYFTRTPGGQPKFADRPSGPHAWTAYAGRPLPDVQVITLDWFDITADRARLGLDPQQRSWLRGVLRRAERDGVRWTIVQGHLPILGPVRTRGSSGLYVPGGPDSKVWQLFEQYGVDLYLTGEAHDVTVLNHGGVTQITHGGLFAFGLTNALLLDFYDDYIYLTLRDYDIRDRDKGGRLWQTRRSGLPARIEMNQAPYTVGTGVVPDQGGLRLETGMLLPGL